MDTCWQREIWFSPKEFHWVCQACSKTDPCLGVDNQQNMNCFIEFFLHFFSCFVLTFFSYWSFVDFAFQFCGVRYVLYCLGCLVFVFFYFLMYLKDRNKTKFVEYRDGEDLERIKEGGKHYQNIWKTK